ncbi:MAG: hypothetical protein M0R74_01395 [Dehalococcoidia bacterium]|nr:hypothetical protein [Dehalococcoidia bacterium]
MSLAELNTVKSKVLGVTAGLALLLGLAGAGLAANQASAQSPTATATATATATESPTTAPTAPTTGSGTVNDSTSLAIPIAALAVVLLGGGVAFALASRNQS